MALYYQNLDEQTRQFMLAEVNLDASEKNLYISSRLNELGQQNYESLLKEAVCNHTDEWLADELRNRNYMKTNEQRRKPKGGFTTAKVPVTASNTLAEGEFNRFYVRGLCARAIKEGISQVEIYRAKTVTRSRPESEEMIGKRFPAEALLEDLRHSQGVEPALGLPPGPNSGLTARLSK